MMKLLKIINELPIWEGVLTLTLGAILVLIFSIKAMVVIAAIMLYLMLTAKAGE